MECSIVYTSMLNGLFISHLRTDFNPLQDNKILVWSKLKQIADDI